MKSQNKLMDVFGRDEGCKMDFSSRTSERQVKEKLTLCIYNIFDHL